jgi:hypothetical protein
VIGWVSIWPGRAAELGTIESMVHRTFFNLPHHVSICIDSETEQVVAYQTDSSGNPVAIPIQSVDTGTDSALTHLPSPLPDVAEPMRSETAHAQE